MPLMITVSFTLIPPSTQQKFGKSIFWGRFHLISGLCKKTLLGKYYYHRLLTSEVNLSRVKDS